MGSDIIRWVHMSDLHLEKDKELEIQHILDLLWLDLREQIRKLGGPLNLAFFSGDLAKNGSEDQYKVAKARFILPLLEHTALNASSLYIVPGNHDVSWAGDIDLSALIQKALELPEQADELWDSPLAKTHIFTRMAAFDVFSKKSILKHKLPGCTKTHCPKLSNRHRLEIVMLNSAWASGLTKDKTTNKPHDDGSLLVTRRQLNTAFGKLTDGALRILIMHHPLDWLQEEDEKSVSPQIHGSCQIILHGHLHKPTIQNVETAQGQVIMIPAGSLYKGSTFLNGYNLVELDLQSGCGVVVLRRYSDELDRWIVDMQSTGDHLNGYYPFIVRSLFDKACGEDEPPDLHLLEQAYRDTPSVPDKGYQRYWHAYNRLQDVESSRGLRLLARMVRLQGRWLEGAEKLAALAEAAAFLYDRPPEEELTEVGLRELLDAGDLPEPIAFEANFLIARLLDDGEKKAETFAHFTLVTELGRGEWINKQRGEDQTSTKEKIIRAYIQRAYLTDDVRNSIEDLSHAGEMAVAIKDKELERYCRLVLAGLLGHTKDEGNQQEADRHREKGEAIRNPPEPQSWKQVAEAIERGDRGELYYWSAAIHHGLGYHRKKIEVTVEEDGSARLIGTCHVLATRELGVLDTYLQTIPGNSDTFKFTEIRSISPSYALRYVDVGGPDLARVYIVIDPPLPPGKDLEYVWEAEARAGTIATTADALRASGSDYEYVAWQVIVPIRQLEIVVSIPSRQVEPLPKFWSDLWRIGPVPKPETAAYRGAVGAASMAQTGEGFGGVKSDSRLLPPDRRQLKLTADHPWLALRQVLAWEVC